MAVDTKFYFNDLLHKSNSDVTITASGTAAGYSVDNVRDTNLLTAWKDADSTTASIWLKVDGGSTGWLGAAGETATVAIAYDSRGNEQDTLHLEYGTVDDGAFATPNSVGAFTLDKTLGVDVLCQYFDFSIPGTAKQWWRLIGYGTARSEAAGDNVPKIYAFSMFDKDTQVRLGDAVFPGDAPGAGQMTPITRTAVARTAVGALASNNFAGHGMRFETTFQPGSVTLWKAVRDYLAAQGGPNRANFIQHEGLKNSDQDDFFLCRLLSNDFSSFRSYIDNYEASLTWETEPWL